MPKLLGYGTSSLKSGDDVAKLTPKQEGFCQTYTKTGNAQDAYRLYYAENLPAEKLDYEIRRLLDSPEVSQRLSELMIEKEVATLDDKTPIPKKGTQLDGFKMMACDGTKPDDELLLRLSIKLGITSINEVAAMLHHTVTQLSINTEGVNKADDLNRAASLILAMEPTNRLELLLASQMAAIHSITMKTVNQTINTRWAEAESLNKQVAKLSRVFIDQINTLQKMRGKGQQKIIVEKVNVESGGKAAIGINGGEGKQ